jgi:hypothetical protein
LAHTRIPAPTSTVSLLAGSLSAGRPLFLDRFPVYLSWSRQHPDDAVFKALEGLPPRNIQAVRALVAIRG